MNLIRNNNFSNRRFVTNVILILIAVMCVLPFFMIISTSFLSEAGFSSKGYALFPRELCLDSYKFVFRTPGKLIDAYILTIFVTVVGTVGGTLLMTLMAYTISRNDYKFKGFISFFIYFTMLFNGGMVARYIWFTQYLHLYGKVAVLILPYMMNASHILILRMFCKNIPDSLIENAKIEGAGEWLIFFKIIIPLAKTGVATIALLTAFAYWNNWMASMLFMDSSEKMTLQYYLIRVLEEVNLVNSGGSGGMLSDATPPNESVRMAICLLAVGPMTLVFPFFQKYFVKGLVVGSVKG